MTGPRRFICHPEPVPMPGFAFSGRPDCRANFLLNVPNELGVSFHSRFASNAPGYERDGYAAVFPAFFLF